MNSTPHFIDIQSKTNPRFLELKKLAQDNLASRKLGKVWVEGDHLCRAAITRGLQPQVMVVNELGLSQLSQLGLTPAPTTLVLADKLWQEISSLPSPANVAYLIDLPTGLVINPLAPTVVLDRLQDPGNVGSILRSASAFGFQQIISLKGSCALWSPKVLRASMGANFALTLIEGQSIEDVALLKLPLLATSSHEGEYVGKAPLPWPCAWIMGHEGQGVQIALEQMATQKLRINQPGGEESLNVAAAAAICLFASSLSSP
jgi:TrmH family RNA methyltransferase